MLSGKFPCAFNFCFMLLSRIYFVRVKKPAIRNWNWQLTTGNFMGQSTLANERKQLGTAGSCRDENPSGGKTGGKCFWGAGHGGGVRKIVGCTNSWPKAMRMLCDNNCIAGTTTSEQLGDWRLPGTAIEICFAD